MTGPINGLGIPDDPTAGTVRTASQPGLPSIQHGTPIQDEERLHPPPHALPNSADTWIIPGWSSPANE